MTLPNANGHLSYPARLAWRATPTLGLDSLDKYVKAWHCFWRAQQRLIRGVDRIGLIWAAGGCCVVSCYECGMSRSPSPSSSEAFDYFYVGRTQHAPTMRIICIDQGGGELWTAILCNVQIFTRYRRGASSSSHLHCAVQFFRTSFVLTVVLACGTSLKSDDLQLKRAGQGKRICNPNRV